MSEWCRLGARWKAKLAGGTPSHSEARQRIRAQRVSPPKRFRGVCVCKSRCYMRGFQPDVSQSYHSVISIERDVRRRRPLSAPLLDSRPRHLETDPIPITQAGEEGRGWAEAYPFILASVINRVNQPELSHRRLTVKSRPPSPAAPSKRKADAPDLEGVEFSVMSGWIHRRKRDDFRFGVHLRDLTRHASSPLSMGRWRSSTESRRVGVVALHRALRCRISATLPTTSQSAAGAPADGFQRAIPGWSSAVRAGWLGQTLTSSDMLENRGPEYTTIHPATVVTRNRKVSSTAAASCRHRRTCPLRAQVIRVPGMDGRESPAAQEIHCAARRQAGTRG